MRRIVMLAIGLSLIGLTAPIYASDYLTFSQGGTAVTAGGTEVTAVAVGDPYWINGHTHVKNAPMYLCLEELPRNVCYPVVTDAQGDFSMWSWDDPCNFELHEKYTGGATPVTTVVCDLDPKTVTFMIVRPGTGRPILTTADLTFEVN